MWGRGLDGKETGEACPQKTRIFSDFFFSYEKSPHLHLYHYHHPNLTMSFKDTQYCAHSCCVWLTCCVWRRLAQQSVMAKCFCCWPRRPWELGTPASPISAASSWWPVVTDQRGRCVWIWPSRRPSRILIPSEFVVGGLGPVNWYSYKNN